MLPGRSLFRTPAKKAVLVILLLGLAVAAGWRLLSSEGDEKVDPEIEAKAERIRSELLDYAPPESNVPDRADAGSTGATQRPTRQPRPND